MVTGWSACVIAFLIYFFYVIVIWQIAGDKPRNPRDVFPLMMLTLLNVQCFFWGGLRRQRFPTLAHEVMLPVDRPTYVNQLGSVIAINQLQLWVGTTIIIAAGHFFLTRQQLSVTNLAVLLGIITSLQIWFFGLGAWLVRFRNLGMDTLVVVMMLAAPVAMIPLTLFTEQARLGKYVLPSAGIIAVLGLLITYDAYRRWLAADFD